MATAVSSFEQLEGPARRFWPEARPSTLRQLSQFWAVRSLGVSAFGAALDIAVMVSLVHFLGWDPVFATAFGVAAGGTLNFFLNKYVAFRDRDPNVGLQALRYAAATGLAFVLYEGVFYTLLREFQVEYIVAKILADLLVFNAGALILNRHIVFPDRTMLAGQAIRIIACFALGFAFTGSPALSAGQHFAQSVLTSHSTSGHHASPVQISNPGENASQPLAARARSVLDGPELEPAPRCHPETVRIPLAPDLEPPRHPPRLAV
jgi:putative flippase GtrA